MTAPRLHRYNCPRTATLTARTDCVLWSLDRTSFRRVLLEENARKAKLHEQFLEKESTPPPPPPPLLPPLLPSRVQCEDGRACDQRCILYPLTAGDVSCALRLTPLHRAPALLPRLGLRSLPRLTAAPLPSSAGPSALQVPLLGPLSKAQRNRMVDALESAAAAPGEVIIAQGAEGAQPSRPSVAGHAALAVEPLSSPARARAPPPTRPGTHFYVIDVGEVHISNRENGFLATRGPGDYFGEASLRTGAPTIATVTAHSACKLVRMDRGAFQRLLGPVNALLRMRSYNDVGQEVDDAPAGGPDAGRQAPAAVVASGSGEGVPRALAREKRAMSLAEFDCSEKVLGEGAFGKVRRALHRGTGQVYAIKEMGKAEVVASGQVEHILQVRAPRPISRAAP